MKIFTSFISFSKRKLKFSIKYFHRSYSSPSVVYVDVYMAPEVYKNEPFDKSVDVYSFGIMLYEVYSYTPNSIVHCEALPVHIFQQCHL